MPSPELDLVRLAARATLGPERAARLRHAVERGPDWPEVLRLALYHRLAALLYVHLRDHAEAPEYVVSALRDEVRGDSVRVLFLGSEMARVAERFRAEGVRYLVMKGPSLAEAYGGVAKRPFVDNDVWVRPQDFGLAARVLTDLGFAAPERSARQRAAHLWVHGETVFERTVGGARSAVDLHTALVPAGFRYAPPFEGLAARARALDLAGATVPALGWNDLFLALCVNALKDQWDRLRLATDVAEVARCVSDWDAVDARAGQFGSRRAVHLAVLVAADEVDGAFPPDVLRQSRRDRRAAELARRAGAFLAASAQRRVRPGHRRAALNLLVQDGLRGQLRYAGYAAARRLAERWTRPTPAATRRPPAP